MTFWSEATLQPKRNFRWLLRFGDGSGNEEIVWWAKTVTVPSYDVSETEHDFMDNKYYYPGRVTWSEISMTLVDPVSPDATGRTLKILNDSGYKVKQKDELGNNAGRTTISKKNATGALGTIRMELLTADGEMLETWSVVNAFIKSAKYGDLDYSNDELRTIEMTVRYDYAECIFGVVSGRDSGNQPKNFAPKATTTE